MIDASSLPLMDELVDVEIDQFDNDDDQDMIQQPEIGAYNHASNMSNNNRKPEKAKWSVQEDNILQQAVQIHDAKNWKSIASFLEGKTEVQVSRLARGWTSESYCSILLYYIVVRGERCDLSLSCVLVS